MDVHDFAELRQIVGAANRDIHVICGSVRPGNHAMVLQLLVRAHKQEQTITRF
ncbi:MAG TPA: hypothetical protein VNZ02_10015 [Steroidobacteraceae bacterium]|jgi:hypothetical protein|nr:hypothetical protein [Steroidobacteraceae bacterium]